MSLEKSEKGGIIESGSDNMENAVEYKILGKLNTQPLAKEFGCLQTDEVIVTSERIEHINK